MRPNSEPDSKPNGLLVSTHESCPLSADCCRSRETAVDINPTLSALTNEQTFHRIAMRHIKPV